jgi:hypothetical protein
LKRIPRSSTLGSNIPSLVADHHALDHEAVQFVEVEQCHRVHVPVAVVEHGHGEGLGYHPAHLDRACEVDERLRDVEAVLGRAGVDYKIKS